MAGGKVGTEMRVKKDRNTRGGALGRPRARPWKGEEKGKPNREKHHWPLRPRRKGDAIQELR